MSVQAPRVAVVVLNWNGFADTVECLASVEDLSYPNLLRIVVDNGSTDGSADKLPTLFPQWVFLRNSQNLGYAEGNNVGLRHALACGADYVMLLNNDTRVDPDSVTELVSAAEADPSIGALGPRIFYWDRPGVIWFDGAIVDPATSEPRHLGLLEPESGLAGGVVETGYVSGCAMMVRATVLREVGLLDADYFLVFEETDLCTRIARQGYRTVVVPRAKVWHKVSVSFGGEESVTYLYYFHRNNLLYVHKRLRGPQQWRAYFHVLKRQFHYVWHLYRKHNPEAHLRRRVIARAQRDFLLRRWGEADLSNLS